ncbi:hypothetical protein BDQ17DRAFT_1331085 [Cyathus striatus]|nr:hypothetical protein BDQ17DRAFT_1331085 [Cyathus striatus]
MLKNHVVLSGSSNRGTYGAVHAPAHRRRRYMKIVHKVTSRSSWTRAAEHLPVHWHIYGYRHRDLITISIFDLEERKELKLASVMTITQKGESVPSYSVNLNELTSGNLFILRLDRNYVNARLKDHEYMLTLKRPTLLPSSSVVRSRTESLAHSCVRAKAYAKEVKLLRGVVRTLEWIRRWSYCTDGASSPDIAYESTFRNKGKEEHDIRVRVAMGAESKSGDKRCMGNLATMLLSRMPSVAPRSLHSAGPTLRQGVLKQISIHQAPMSSSKFNSVVEISTALPPSMRTLISDPSQLHPHAAL